MAGTEVKLASLDVHRPAVGGHLRGRERLPHSIDEDVPYNGGDGACGLVAERIVLWSPGERPRLGEGSSGRGHRHNAVFEAVEDVERYPAESI